VPKQSRSPQAHRKFPVPGACFVCEGGSSVLTDSIQVYASYLARSVRHKTGSLPFCKARDSFLGPRRHQQEPLGAGHRTGCNSMGCSRRQRHARSAAAPRDTSLSADRGLGAQSRLPGKILVATTLHHEKTTAARRHTFRFVRRNRGWNRVRAACQVSGRGRVRGRDRCENRKIFSW